MTHSIKKPMIRKAIAVPGAFLSLATLLHAHPGHSAFDMFASPPHGGHDVEYAFFFLGALAILAASVRAWVKSQD